MNTDNTRAKATDWLDEHEDDGYDDFTIIDNVDSLTIICKGLR